MGRRDMEEIERVQDDIAAIIERIERLERAEEEKPRVFRQSPVPVSEKIRIPVRGYSKRR